MPHHRFLASPARRLRLTSRLMAVGQGGGGVASPQVVGRAPQWGVDQVGEPAGTHARTPPGGELTADRVNATGADAGPGRRLGQGVGGGALNWPPEAVFNGAMLVHGPGHTGMGPDSRPRWFLVVLLGGGGGVAELFCWNGGRSKEGEQPSCGKTQRASTLGNHCGG